MNIFKAILFCLVLIPGVLYPGEQDGPIARYDDIYFIFGSPNSKIQISFKYRFINNLDLYLAYTQVMFWDLGQESSPFKDVNYNPDLFYRLKLNVGMFKSLDFGFFDHKSNGRDGENTRTFNRSYLRLNMKSRFNKNWSFRFVNKFYTIYRLDDTNIDIREYMGFWEGKISIVNNYDDFLDRAEVYFRMFSGGRDSSLISKGAKEVGISVRLGYGKFFPLIFFQYYDGYVESLLEYNQYHKSYRIGILF
jgi:phospholipase A1